ncbi:hypothetical protein [Actinomadura rugatobispora]|uniref:Uncharacterized protein n=1 Tax=Actinomadura rugatobispora TaxID=1994 RepID=A0ABW1AFM7_9ACTN
MAIAVEAMYGYALLTGRRPTGVAAMNRAFLCLLTAWESRSRW